VWQKVLRVIREIKMTDEWLVERLKTTKNLCEIALLLKEQNRDEYLPTILELLLYYAQTVVEKTCVVEE